MANILRIGILFATLTFFLALFEPIEAGEGKKKRVIIKVPTRIKHVYHHHTKKIHIRKKKPKTKPDSVHVVHVEDEIVPVKDWQSIEWKTKSLSGPKKSKKPKWSSETFDWKEPKGFASDESHEAFGGSSGIEDDYYPQSGESYGWHEESIEYGRPKGKRGIKHRGKGKLRGIGDYEDPHYESSFVQEERRPLHKRPSHPRHKQNRSKERANKRTTKRPKIDDIYIGPEDYEDYGKGVWPERKEHPSWHQKKQNKQWSQPIPLVKEDPSESDNFDSETKWVPTSNPMRVHPSMDPIVVPEVQPQVQQRPPAGSGYHSQLSHSPDGKSIGYQSHVGHSSDSSKPSSSFQSVTFGGIKHR